ncbi:hypothetical protein PM082_023364 [Marasmius tenuissimus]|nr:hypothetical protein PM082_023364 [Marasmius tenuissimus]
MESPANETGANGQHQIAATVIHNNIREEGGGSEVRRMKPRKKGELGTLGPLKKKRFRRHCLQGFQWSLGSSRWPLMNPSDAVFRVVAAVRKSAKHARQSPRSRGKNEE